MKLFFVSLFTFIILIINIVYSQEEIVFQNANLKIQIPNEWSVNKISNKYLIYSNKKDLFIGVNEVNEKRINVVFDNVMKTLNSTFKNAVYEPPVNYNVNGLHLVLLTGKNIDGQFINYALVSSPNGKTLEFGSVIRPDAFSKYKDILIYMANEIIKINGNSKGQV